MDKVTHFEIPSEDMDRAEAFYQGVFGWQVFSTPVEGARYDMAITTPTGPDFRPTETNGINGAFCMKDEMTTVPLVVIEVDSIEETLRKVTEAGGSVVMPAFPIGEMGFYARFSDSEGNVLGLWQNR